MKIDHPYIADKLPRYAQIRYLIQEQLASQTWKLNEAIPTEQELALSYNVSVGTVRKAVDQLVEDGLLIRLQGKGTFVRNPEFTTSLVKFFRYRDKEGQTVIPIGRVQHISKVKSDIGVSHKLAHTPNASLIYIERTREFDDKVMVSEKIWLPYDRFKALLKISPADFENLLYPFYIKTCGQLIVSAKEQLQFEPSYSDQYLCLKKNEPAMKITRFAYGIKGEILEYRESYGRAKDFFYETVIS